MKLKEFTPDNCISYGSNRETEPFVKFKKAGVVVLNKVALELIGIKIGDTIVLVQDEEDPENWYIKASSGKQGWPLRPVKNTEQAFVQSSMLVRAIFSALGIDTGKQVRMKLAGKPTEDGKTRYWGILTNTAQWDGKKI